MPATDADWQRAFALQALSDLDAREYLAETAADLCHELHFFQMASEKVCKAHLIQAEGYKNLRMRHDVVAKTLPILARQVYGLEPGYKLKAGQRVAIQKIAHEIEVLSPICNESKSRLDNSEYPWLDGQGDVQIPCRHSFPGFVNDSRTLVQVIQLLRRAAKMYAK